MKKTRAAAVAIVGLTLTATGALAAAPHLQSTLARGTHGSPDATSGTDATTGTQGAHGAAVSTVAKDPAAVGGPNNNHGGAVSAVARGTHGSPDATSGTTVGAQGITHGKSGGKSQAGAHSPSH